MTETPTPSPTVTPSPTPAPISVGVPAGTIAPYAGVVIPEGWLLADGSAVSRADYPALWGVIGEIYGAGNGTTTFNLPDLRGRSPIGAGQGSGLTFRVIGVKVGAETHTLTIAEMPAHTHGIQFWGFTSINSFALPAWWGGNFVNTGTIQTQSNGGGAAHNNMQPSLAVNYIIKTTNDTIESVSGGSTVQLPTPTPPQHIVYATVEAGGYDPVTVAYEYSLTGGDFLTSTLLFLMICLQVVNMVMQRGGKDG